MTTKTAVLNKALRALGEAAMVGPDDTRVGVRRCVEAYDDVVTGLLSSHPWNFAMSVVALSGSTAPKPGWTYAFPKPGDCLRIVRISVTDQPDDVGLRYADSAGEILTNQMNPYLRFISSTWRTNEGAWPELFADAVGDTVAYEVGPTLSKGESAMERLERRATSSTRKARSWDAQQQPNFQVPPGRFVRARAGRSWGRDYGES